MDKAERKKYDEAERSGELEKLRQRVMSFCVPFWWEVNRNQICANGSMCVIATPQARFGVTADHVLGIYECHKAEKADVFCQLGSTPFDPVPNVIDRSRHWDLATFRIPDFTLNHWGPANWVYQTEVWPPPTVKTGNHIIIGGYPENRRSQSEGELPQTMSTDFVTFIGTVDSSSDNHFALNLDSPNWYWPQGEELPPKPILSGASGGPCFLIFPDENRIELAGVIYEDLSEFEIVRARQANLIDAKGKIKPGF